MVVLTWLSQKGKAVTGIPADTQALGKQSIGPIPIPFIILSCCFDPDFIYGKEDKDGSLHICDW